MFDEEDRKIGYALFIAIGMAILVSILTIGLAGGSAIGSLGQKSARGALPVKAAARVAPGASAQSIELSTPPAIDGEGDAREARQVEAALR